MMKTPMRLNVSVMTMMPSDIDAILRFERELFGSDAQWTEEVIRHHWHTNGFGYVSSYEGTICGYVFVEAGDTELRISNIGVGKKYQRYGVGTELVDRVKRKLRDSPARRFIGLTVAEDRLDNLHFFKSCGFFASKLNRRMFSADLDGIEMEWWS